LATASATSGAGDEEGDVEHVVAEGLIARFYQYFDHFHVQYRGDMTYGVGSDMDPLLLAVLNQVVALQDGVTLDLVDGGHNSGTVDDGLEVGDGVVGDTDGAGLALGKLGHGWNHIG
jgi:hypothetical protein